MQSVRTSTTAEASDQPRVLTWRDTDRLSVFEAVDRWLNRELSFMHERDPEHHLEELALMTMGYEWLTRWRRSACIVPCWRAHRRTKWPSQPG